LKKQTIRPLLSLATLIMAAPALYAQQQPQQPIEQPQQMSPQPVQPVNENPNAPVPQSQENPNAFQFRASLGWEHDSNVLRVPSVSNPQSDNVLIAGVGLKFDRRIGLQRLRADVAADKYKYQDNSNLDYTTINYSLAWDWAVTSALHGVLSAERRQFRDVTTDPLFATNLVGRRTERVETFEGIYEFGGGLRALAGASHSEASSTQPRSYDASPDVKYVHVGVGYEFPSGTSLTARLKRGDGEYTDPSFGAAGVEFRDREAELAVKWPVTGRTSLEARIAHLKREHSAAPQLDFDGVVGNATVRWDITGKTQLQAGYIRDLSGSGLPTGGHVTSQRWFVAPVWKATAKTSFNARYDHIRREWNDIPAATFSFGREETIQAASIGVDWEALRRLTVSAYARNERMKSNLSAGYRATVYGIAAKANF
jgi:exopolysaccharide biosynthesis operon protein EpsL